jgi:hypothetical protein
MARPTARRLTALSRLALVIERNGQSLTREVNRLVAALHVESYLLTHLAPIIDEINGNNSQPDAQDSSL